jgi:hypothetical protein
MGIKTKMENCLSHHSLTYGSSSFSKIHYRRPLANLYEPIQSRGKEISEKEKRALGIKGNMVIRSEFPIRDCELPEIQSKKRNAVSVGVLIY